MDGNLVKAGQDVGDVGLGFNGITGEIDPSLSFYQPIIFKSAELGSGANDLSIAPDFTKVVQLIGDGSGRDLSTTRNVLAARSSADVATINTSDVHSYSYAASTTIYDSLGIDHVLNLYFRKIADNTWNVYQQAPDIRSTLAIKIGSLGFDSRGFLFETKDVAGYTDINDPTTLKIIGLQFGNGAGRQNVQLNFSDTTQFDSAFVTNLIEQNGYTMGSFTGVAADESGMIVASYSNNQIRIVGQVALACFANNQGLRRIGDNNWIATQESGQAIVGRPGDGKLGQLAVGALEGSNVELTQELVDMIIAQRSFQANAQVVNTISTLYQTMLNIR